MWYPVQELPTVEAAVVAVVVVAAAAEASLAHKLEAVE
jgi:hypothetical protein